MFSLSSRSNRIRPQPMFEILAEANRLELLGEDIVRLEIGDTSSEVSPQLLQVLNASTFDSRVLGYSPSAGETVLRQELATLHNTHKGTALGFENVAVLPANAAVSHLFSILTEPGDSVLLSDPCFPTYRLAARYLELDVVDVPLIRNRGYSLDIGAISSQVQSNKAISAVLIDSPSNPVGIAHSPDDLLDLARVCEEQGVALIIDETYRNLVYQTGLVPERMPSSVIWIYSISKDAGAPGMRIGSVVGPEQLVEKIAALSSLTFSCLPKFFQIAATRYLSQATGDLEGKKKEYQSRIVFFGKRLSEDAGLRVAPSNSSIYLWVDISKTGIDSHALAQRLLQEAKVAVCPGEGFGPSGADHVRVTVAGSYHRLNEGIDRILLFLNQDRYGSAKIAQASGS